MRIASVPAVELSALLDQIDDAALGGDVTRALLCQKLAGHAGSEELRSWAERELAGYPPDAELPEFRSIRGVMTGQGIAPGARFQHVTIPSDILPKELLDEGFLDLPVRWSIAEVQVAADAGKDVTVVPHNSALLAQVVNSANQGAAQFEQVHFACSSATFLAITTAVKSRLLSLTAELRQFLPDDASLDDRKLSRAVENASVVVLGDHNTIATATASSQAIARSTRWWQPLWVKITGGCGLVALGVAIEEIWRRAEVWPF